MLQRYVSIFFQLLFFWLSFAAQATQHPELPVRTPEPEKSLLFIETRNRIGHGVQYEAAVPGGKLFLHPNKFTYIFAQGPRHEHGPSGESSDHRHSETEKPKAHAYSVTFEGAQQAIIKPGLATETLYNYFLGNDKSKWVSGARGYRQVDYDNLYPGIDMRLREQNGKLKYEFFLETGANPALIKMRYDGAEKLTLKNGELIVTTTVNTVTESRPYTYQIINGKQKAVACHFKVTGTEVSFEFPEGYDTSYPLVIDPELMYSTYSGSSANNWGFTATYDAAGNLYSGGIVFGVGFPVTVGAIDASFNGTTNFKYDIGILKFNPNLSGTASLVYATYLGGLGSEAPHSLVVNNADELLIYGTTGSADYPTTTQAYDANFAGGPGIIPLFVGDTAQTHPNGSDIIISKLSSNGQSLLASTFLGGTNTDGLILPGHPLLKNYGDQFRGDIITDANNNVYITSSTYSADFPIINGFQTAIGGPGTDGIVCKLSPDLSSLLWSTYLGGSGMDASYSIQLDDQNNVVVAGGTNSPNFPASANSYSPTYNQGIDGFIARIAASGNLLQRATYLGTTAYDQVYFVQLDDAENVYVLGQTQGSYPVSQGVYSVPNSKQFIHKLDPNLSSTVFSTVFGSASGTINISPTAFLVNHCNTIYAAGWGGGTNASYIGGNTHGMPITADATQATTDGSDFYMIALSNNASQLVMGTYMGAPGINEHVDGGTSRFDRNSANGIVYQAVCAGCWGSSTFPTTPNAYSNQNPSLGCNNAAYKYQIPELEAAFTPSLLQNGPYADSACAPATFYFRRESQTGVTFVWDFGDGTTSSSPGPVQHLYLQPGIYPVSLTVTDSATCAISLVALDTLVVGAPTGQVSPDTTLCLPGTVQLQATGGVSYYWTPSTTLSDSVSATPIASPIQATTYTVLITNDFGCTTAKLVTVSTIERPDITSDTLICSGQSVQLQVTPGLQSYSWSPDYQLSATGIPNPVANPAVSTNYTVEVNAGGGCLYTEFVNVAVNPSPEITLLSSDTTLCSGAQVQLQVISPGQNSYTWSPASGLSTATGPSPVATPAQTTNYTVLATNNFNCTASESVLVSVIPFPGIAADGIIAACEGEVVQLETTPVPGLTYSWTPSGNLSDPTSPNPTVPASATTTYYLAATGLGCSFTDSVLVAVFPEPELSAAPEFPAGVAPYPLAFTNQSTGATAYSWNFGNGQVSTDIHPIVTYAESGTYPVVLTAVYGEGCLVSDTVATVKVVPPFVPNIITPNGDGVNDVFVATLTNLALGLEIYNRWGNLLYRNENYQQDWGGDGLPEGVYYYHLFTPDGRTWKGWLEIVR